MVLTRRDSKLSPLRTASTRFNQPERSRAGNSAARVNSVMGLSSALRCSMCSEAAGPAQTALGLRPGSDDGDAVLDPVTGMQDHGVSGGQPLPDLGK